MPKKYIVFLKSVGRRWFLLLIIILIIVALYNITLSIILTIVTLILFLLSYIPRFLLKRKMLKTMKEYYRIEEKTLIKETGKDPQKIHNIIFNFSKNQEKKKWLIVYQNDNYIFYHKDLISKFKELHDQGYGEKKIFEILKKADIQTRAEIKKIHETLRSLDRLEKTVEELEIDEELNRESNENEENIKSIE
ncbi:MAG: hypothetical protein P8Y70_10065 [Candidatus Lokiarchaeota archaeon]